MCTEVMLMKKSFRKAVLPVILLSVVGICIISVFVLTYLKRYSVHINRVLSIYEINQICKEFHLNSENVNIEYVFWTGNDLYGVRFIPIDTDRDFTENSFLFDETEGYTVSDIIGNNNSVEYESSSGIVNAFYVSGNKLDYLYKDQMYYYVYLFETAGEYHVEIVKSDTDNMLIYQE